MWFLSLIMFSHFSNYTTLPKPTGPRLNYSTDYIYFIFCVTILHALKTIPTYWEKLNHVTFVVTVIRPQKPVP